MKKENTIRLLSKYRLPIMGFAALWILMFHVWIPIMGDYGRLLSIETFVKQMGFCGVDIFLIASGLGLVYAIEKYDLWTYYKRRFLHVYPPFFFVGFGLAFFRGWELRELLEKIFFIRFFTDNILAYLWYVPAILLFYLFFPLYYKFFKKALNKYWFVACSLGVWLIVSLALNGILRTDFYGITNRIPVFIVGVLIGWLIENEEIVFNKWHWLLAFLILVIGIVLAYLTNIKGMYLLVPISNCCIPNFCLASSLYFLLANIYNLAERKLGEFGAFIVKIFSFFGKYSLPIYCVQEYLNTDFMKNPPSDRPIILNVLLFICIVCAGVGLHIFCELVKKCFSQIAHKITIKKKLKE